MSLRYRNSQGTETPVAGLNGTSGELVPSVALYQQGRITIQATQNAVSTANVVLSTPMPDVDYIVNLELNSAPSLSSIGSIGIHAVSSPSRKSVNGFEIAIYNDTDTDTSIIVQWQAFKLMTDTVHEADAAHIAQNTANFAPAFSEVTSYAVGDYCTYNNVLYRCTTAHTAGTWVAGHFTQVTVGERLKPLEAVVPTAGVGTGINKQDIVSGGANTAINIPAYHFSTGLMYLSISGIGTALLSYETDNSGNLNLKVIAGIGVSLTASTLYKGSTPLGAFSRSGDYIVFTAQYFTTIRTDYASL